MENVWEAMAGWYDERQGEEGDPWHRQLIDPTLFLLIGDVAGLSVLDLACGNGYVARRLRRAGAATVIGVDSSGPIIERARARETAEPLGVTYEVALAADLDVFAHGSFDLVVSNMALMDIENADAALKESRRVLKVGGRLVASLCHPCFDVPDAAVWAVEVGHGHRTVWRKVSRYREPFQGALTWLSSPEQWRTPAFHRPLSWYFRSLRNAGFLVRSFEEPAPAPEMLESDLQGLWIAEIPVQCVIEAVAV